FCLTTLRHPRDLHSFPTRRSSDLVRATFSTTLSFLCSFSTSTADIRMSPYLTLVGHTVSHALHPKQRSMPSCISPILIFSSATIFTKFIRPLGECFSVLKAI